jgi:oligoribonuclease
MAQDANRLIWIDMEMTGLKPEADRIIEVALVITDQELNVVAEGPVRVVHQGDDILDAMDSWNKGTHGRSGLIDRVKAATASEAEVEDDLIRFVAAFVPPNASPMCGNSVCQDRRFLARYMSKLEAYFHYRNLDVSTLKELARRWKPEVMAGFVKQSKHQALADVYESIQELRYYRGQLLRI